ncbi:MAG: hypothetical protein OEW60_05700, partial [Thiovulaceae bacterium]|nr:hypothetical protein [Sulfurimonadaceae bacterium]
MKYFLLIFILLPQLHAFTITQDDIDYEKFPLEVFTDTTNKLTIDSVKNADFNNALSKESYGYKRGKTFWLRFTLKNQSSKDQELYLYHKDAYSYLNVVFYELQAGRLLKTLNLSRNIPMESKQIKDSSPVYVVTLKKGEEKEFYIKNQSRSTMLVNLQLLDAPHYHKANLYKNAFYFFFFGIVISLAIYNLILFASVRAIEYLYYVFFMFGSISYLFYASGVPLEFFGVTGSMFSLLLYGVGVLQAALILFSQKVLETKQHLPKVHRFLNAVFALN